VPHADEARDTLGQRVGASSGSGGYRLLSAAEIGVGRPRWKPWT
jgi:hypothetical protein